MRVIEPFIQIGSQHAMLCNQSSTPIKAAEGILPVGWVELGIVSVEFSGFPLVILAVSVGTY